MSAPNGQLLTPAEVATAFGVDRRTVTRWVLEGKLPPESYIRTPGRHRRYHRAYIEALLRGEQP